MQRRADGDSVGDGERLKTGGEIDGVAENRQLSLEFRHDDGADIEADADLRPGVVVADEFVASRLQPTDDAERGLAGAKRSVLVGPRRSKHRHDAVAGETLHGSAEVGHDPAHQPRERLHQPKRRFLAVMLREGCEADHVGEQNCDLPALWLHGR